ncbi:MAG: cephalosporin hydroxylase [Telmatospirillum sp.]|nr:cephalosporin hydroxylase [Telmatospirillum sp.]
MSKTSFEIEREKSIMEAGKDKKLKECGLDFIIKSGKHRYVYNFSWMGRPFIQLPQDIVQMQEIMWTVRPDLVIDVGIAHGGSVIFYASMMEMMGIDGEVLGVDIEIRPHNRDAIATHPMNKRITMLEGSSVDPEIIRKVHFFAKNHLKILVCLDSNHTHDHVLAELRAFAPLVTKGSYCVVFDTGIEDVPPDSFPDRPWGRGNSPKTAVNAYLKTTGRFVVDEMIDAKLVLSAAPGGYLLCVED